MQAVIDVYKYVPHSCWHCRVKKLQIIFAHPKKKKKRKRNGGTTRGWESTPGRDYFFPPPPPYSFSYIALHTAPAIDSLNRGSVGRAFLLFKRIDWMLQIYWGFRGGRSLRQWRRCWLNCKTKKKDEFVLFGFFSSRITNFTRKIISHFALVRLSLTCQRNNPMKRGTVGGYNILSVHLRVTALKTLPGQRQSTASTLMAVMDDGRI